MTFGLLANEKYLQSQSQNYSQKCNKNIPFRNLKIIESEFNWIEFLLNSDNELCNYAGQPNRRKKPNKQNFNCQILYNLLPGK